MKTCITRLSAGRVRLQEEGAGAATLLRFVGSEPSERLRPTCFEVPNRWAHTRLSHTARRVRPARPPPAPWHESRAPGAQAQEMRQAGCCETPGCM